MRLVSLIAKMENEGGASVVDVRDLIYPLWQGRLVVMTTTLLFIAAAAAYAVLTTPIYRATTVVVAASGDRNGLAGALGSVGGLAALAGINLPSGDSRTEEYLAVLRSRQFNESFIKDNNLLTELYARLWDSAGGRWKVAPERQPTLARAFRYFDRIRTISKNTKTGLITLEIEYRDRSKGATWANDLIRRLNAEMRARAIVDADASVGYLEKELANTTDLGTREAINRLIETQIKQRMLANVTQEFALRVVDRAMAADVTDPVRPQKLLLIVGGAVVGLGLGILIVLIGHAFWQKSPIGTGSRT